jgi:predicted MFS family arabinose efflux permease
MIRLLAVAAGLGAANIHYSQPLLPVIASSITVPVDRIGFLPAVTQIGFAAGIVSFLPLADMLERRRLIVTMLALSAAALTLAAAAPNAPIAFLGAFAIGLFGITPQLMTPFAALLAPKGYEGAAVGLVLSGVLVSKVVAGLVTVGLGWRALYWGPRRR